MSFSDSCLKLIDYHGKYMHQIKNNKLKLNLLENAFDYLNTSFEYVIKAESKENYLAWKHAIINLVVAIELFMKEILRQENPILIYADINRYQKVDRNTKTVSWSVAIERLKYITQNEISELDQGRFQKAQQLRNQMLHYDVEIIPQKALNDFANLFDFVKKLYAKYLENYTTKPLEKFLYPEHWKKEKIITKYFGKEFSNYKGYTIYREFLEEQKWSHIILKGEKFNRIKFGDEPQYIEWDNLEGYYTDNCHDCDAVEGLYHSLGCDVAVCPRCHGQLLSCSCLNYLDDIDKAMSALREE